MMQNEIFREYDIRGVYEKDFDLDFAFKLGKAWASFTAKATDNSSPVASVGYDARLSSPDIARAVIDGMKASGVKVYKLGLITSPISYFSTFALDDISGGIMITGSHNPPEYNGFKISVGKTTIHGSDIQKLREIIEAEDYITGAGEELDCDIKTPYLAKYKEEFKDLTPIKVVLDCGNGSAGCIVKDLYHAAGLDPIILFEQPDGTFPNHHPDPTVEHNLVDLKAAVKEHGAAVGIGFDGDADRIGVVDENGSTIIGDELMVIFARDILQTNKGAKIVGDVKCSDRMYTDIEKNGGVPVMWKTGHSLIKEKIKADNAPFGGELSGHIFFSDRNFGYDDAPYAGLRLVEIISKSGKKTSELLAGLPSAFNTPEIRIDTTEEKKHLIVEKLVEKFSKPSDDYTVNLQDGIRISFKDGWGLARASNTQPVLVLRFEASSEESLNSIRNEFESVVNQYL